AGGVRAAAHVDAAHAAGIDRGDRAVSGLRSAAVTVAIVDYGSGNLHSAAKAFERAARDDWIRRIVRFFRYFELREPILLTDKPDQVARAERIVLPGVGAFADCKHGLDSIPGMIDALNRRVRQQGRPFLGICVGMQLMAERGREYEVTKGLGWIAGEVDRITPSDPGLKIPHIGWNTLSATQSHPLLDGLAVGPAGLHAYFV